MSNKSQDEFPVGILLPNGGYKADDKLAKGFVLVYNESYVGWGEHHFQVIVYSDGKVAVREYGHRVGKKKRIKLAEEKSMPKEELEKIEEALVKIGFFSMENEKLSYILCDGDVSYSLIFMLNGRKHGVRWSHHAPKKLDRVIDRILILAGHGRHQEEKKRLSYSQKAMEKFVKYLKSAKES